MTDRWPWGPLRLEPGESAEFSLGTLHLTVRRTRNEFWYLGERPDALDRGSRPEWQRWALPPDQRVALRPFTPDRLLVVSHEHPFHLPPRGQARIFIRIPLVVGLVAIGMRDPRDELTLGEDPTVVLSDTWWGTIEEGELAYWLTTTARSEVSAELFEPHLAMCPVALENRSEEALPVARFAVRPQHLSLFHRDGRIWSDELKVRYLAAEEGSEIHFGGRAPAEEPGAEALAEPREPVRKGFQARTFERLRSIAVLGG